jgi:threonyl-tRNA synthetase
VILPVSDTEMPDAAGLLQRCTDLGLRAQVAGPKHGSLGARIRAARLVPYQAVIGAKEATDDQVALSA